MKRERREGGDEDTWQGRDVKGEKESPPFPPPTSACLSHARSLDLFLLRWIVIRVRREGEGTRAHRRMPMEIAFGNERVHFSIDRRIAQGTTSASGGPNRACVRECVRTLQCDLMLMAAPGTIYILLAFRCLVQ